MDINFSYLSVCRSGYGCQTTLPKIIEHWKLALDQNKYIALDQNKYIALDQNKYISQPY
jgi:hypothetical protein